MKKLARTRPIQGNTVAIIITLSSSIFVLLFLPARASEQGNVIGLVSVYIYIVAIKKTL